MRSQDLPHVMLLLDDPSPVVQAEISGALTAVAHQLGGFLEEQKDKIGPDGRLRLHRFLTRWRKTQLLRCWSAWVHDFFQSPEHEQNPWSTGQYEKAHIALDSFASPFFEVEGLGERLDRLTQEIGSQSHPQALFEALFPVRFVGGAKNYYDPNNGWISRVLRLGQGNPITLASLMILVGHRMGLAIRPCNFPSHFLARNSDKTEYYDCFRAEVHGPELTMELRGGRPLSEFQEVLHEEVATEVVVARVLRNMVASYLHEERGFEGNLFHLLYKDLMARQAGMGIELPLREPIYGLGQIVCHRDKDVRGVVVDYSLYDNSHKGLAHEPLYKILVHESPQVATVRESRLYLDQSGSLVAHPFVSHFFSKFDKGAYLRNSRAWLEKG